MLAPNQSLREWRRGLALVEVEDWLWLLLPLGAALSFLFRSEETKDTNSSVKLVLLAKISYLSLCHCVVLIASQVFENYRRCRLGRSPPPSPSAPAPSTDPHRRIEGGSSVDSGRLMASALIPSLLLALSRLVILAVQQQPDRDGPHNEGVWSNWVHYASWASLTMIATTVWDSKIVWGGRMILMGGTIALVLIVLNDELFPLNWATASMWTILYGWNTFTKNLLELFGPKTLSSKHDSGLVESTTWGEYQILITFGVVGTLDWFRILSDHGDMHAADNQEYTSSVAQSGFLGCYFACQVAHYIPLLPRILFQVFVPLATVEITLWSQGLESQYPYIPRCISWLLTFLTSTENGRTRYFGLCYWVIALAVLLIPTRVFLPKPSKDAGKKNPSLSWSVVVTRKWFHFIAIVLFTPTTIFLPQLLSLSYSIALCVLLVLETLRKDWPMLQTFYNTFQDPTKDQADGLIVSHMFLILGCALPLWISLCCQLDPSVSPLLPQWGILCLGLGDAMGAVVGKGWGRWYWGKNNRTIEGSLAMWTSMMLVGWCFFAEDNRIALFTATTFASVLEAYTTQMDNLVLPLAGSTVILLMASTS